ncbi:hypothetical protein [Devosia sp. A369]
MIPLLPIVALVLVGGVWAGFDGFKECGWLDRWLDRSGCVDSFNVNNLASLGSTMLVDREGRLVIAGVQYGEASRSGRELSTVSQIVIFDPASGTEIERMSVQFNGRPDQLQLSPTEDLFVLTCSSIYTCDLADTPSGGKYSGAAQIAVLDRQGQFVWRVAVPRDIAQPSPEGRAFDLAFADDGAAVVAGPVAFATSDGALLTDAVLAVAPHGMAVDSADIIVIAGAPRDLHLPPDYIPFTRLQTATSADGTCLATLSRRFSGPGDLRAILQVWDNASGEMLVRHDIVTDLSPALAWRSDGTGVLVATASPPAPGTGTQIRTYQAGGPHDGSAR